MRSASRARRILHLHFPYFPTDRLRSHSPRGAKTSPTATIEKVSSGLRIAAVDQIATAAGIVPGQPLAEARAQVPSLLVEHADPIADAKALAALARAADRFTPFVGIDAPQGLFLDVTGCASIFGGEEDLLRDATSRFERCGFATRGAVASSPVVAWAVTRYGPGGIVSIDDEANVLAPLHVAALRLPEETISVLGRLGIKTVAQLLGQPRVPLVRRFGPLLARRIDQAEGRENEPITPLVPTSPFAVERRFAEPLMQMEGVEAAVAGLARRLTRLLEARACGARRISLRLYHADGAVREVLVGASEPLADPLRILALIRPRLDALSQRVETESGIDLMRLRADEVAARVARQEDFAGADSAHVNLARLVDTLSERLGIHCVQIFLPADTHQPVEADLRGPARDNLVSPSWSERDHDTPPRRPVKLFTPPEPIETVASVPDGPPVRFVWRRIAYQVAAAEGPERIAPSWWEADAMLLTADYFRVEDVEGRRFWIFRRGLYAEDPSPNWFMHGLFA